MAVAIVILLLVIGSLVFHFISPWWFTPLASNWSTIDTTINITFWVTGIVFVAVNGFLAYVVFRYRYNKNRRSNYEPENKKLEGWLTLATTVGVVAMLAPGLFVWAQFVSVPEEAHTVEAIGQQWYWSYRLPGEDKQLGRTAVALVSEENPFGIDPNDPFGQDDVLIASNEIHLPVNRPTKVLLRSHDVLHNFAVPQFRVKMDLVPGIVSYLWFTPTKLGQFDILCEELCGMAHYTMRGRVVVEEEENYQTWLNQQTTFAQLLATPPADLTAGKALYTACAACHGVNGEGNKNLHAPQLAGQAAWYLERQLSYYKNKIRGTHKDDTYGQQMAAMSAVLPDKTAIRNVSAYIHSLAVPSSFVKDKTQTGDAERGEKVFRNCALCHGSHGEGNRAMNAPNIAQQHDWYLKQQIKNYQSNIRGNHSGDIYGAQMILMSKLLQDDQSIDDLLAYMNALPTPDNP
ncbi:cytochrome c oxidase subunit II [Vibrio sp. Of7-15]|uniref:cytochrome c oxidase subunit II n=1 Tax=Vibrio sp. Of7-15 TaxID=2724879 RepID=UPI001EF25CEC|nr:cytochrome c oxidase subunit II [Vibrio sp. Of7-15]MCG7497720.1 cytochrome c oxidase subunit II [Vibrio sp. Of7-15]